MKAEETHRRPVPLNIADEHRIGAPLFHAAWLFAVGIVIAHYCWLRPAWMLIAFGPTAVLCGIAALRAQRIIWIPLGVLWCLMGAWCAEMQPEPAPEPKLAILSDGLTRTIEGTVIDAGPVREEPATEVSYAPEDGPSQRIDVRISSLEVVSDIEDIQQSESGIVRMTVHWPGGGPVPTGFGCGQTIRADARLMLPDVYHDPGAWNYRNYLLEQGITATGTLKADRVNMLEAWGVKTLACRISGWQHAASTKLLGLPHSMDRVPAALRLSDDDAIMLAAMVTGDRTYLTHSLPPDLNALAPSICLSSPGCTLAS
jgi:competence protein ComEC